MAYKIPASSVIANQFPEFVVEDYPKFTRFVELYYTFLKETELSGVGNLSTIRDIDTTLDKFVESLCNEFGIDLPKTDIKDDKFFLKHIKDFYSTKGSEESFRILFRHLFNTEIEIKYPKDYIFKSSDGAWVQDLSFLVDVTSGNIFDIVGQQVSISNSQFSLLVSVNRIRPVDNLFEVFIDRINYSAISSGDILIFGDVTATLQKSITKASVYKTGLGFYVGQLFTVPSNLGTDAKIKVTSIDTLGNLTGVELINFGYGYDFEFYATITSTTAADSVISIFPNIISKTLGFIDSGLISSNPYCDENYGSPVYCGAILQEFYTDSSVTENTSIDDEYTAVLNIKVGAVRKYPGFYGDENGFLSNVYKLQDHYYQLFSYLISSAESITSYKNPVKSLVHPAGMRLFGEQNLSNEISLAAYLAILNRFFQVTPHDPIFISDNSTYSMSKLLSESISIGDVYSASISKAFSDSTSVSDSGAITTNPYCDITYVEFAYCGTTLQTF